MNYLLSVIVLFLVVLESAGQQLKKEIQFSQHKFIPCYNLKKAGNTTIFQGNKKKKNYFEGWYFKMVGEDGEEILSVIPGISLSKNGNEKTAFIQVINGKTADTKYFTYSIDDFYFSKKEFAIRIGDNYFSKDSISLNIRQNESVISGTVHMNGITKYRSKRLTNPGIMGWYRFVPFMECYHGVVSLTNDLKGSITMNSEAFDFNNGKGYIEKDWGSSMPSSWVWIQSNHFQNDSSSFMLSIANIPWLGKSFNGFLGFFYHEGEIHHFATYRSTKMDVEFSDSNDVHISIKNRKYLFEITARSSNSGLLQAPVEGTMDRRIAESIDSRLEIVMKNKKGEIIYTDSTEITGLEMVGMYRGLQGHLK
ncbi:MAG: tocopherol cyclase family protein [Crocinitomicaceae bacterium]